MTRPVKFIWLEFQDTPRVAAHHNTWQTWPGVFDSWYMSQIGKKYASWALLSLGSSRRLSDFATGVSGWFYETHDLERIVNEVLIGEIGLSYDDFCPVLICGGGIGGQAFGRSFVGLGLPGAGFAIIGEAGAFLQQPGQEIGPLWHEMAHVITGSDEVGHTRCFEYPGQPMCQEIKDAILMYQADMLTDSGPAPGGLCGTIGAGGTVSVKLTWTPAPGAVSETVRLCVYAPGGCLDYPNVRPGVVLTGLAQGTPYAWSIISKFTDGATVESTQAAFTTPSGPAPVQPTAPKDLKYEILRQATPDKGALVRFTWTKTQPTEQLQYENFLFGRPNRSLTTVEDTRTIYPDQPPQVDKDDVDPGDYGWYVRGLLSGGIELAAPIQALSIPPAPQPAGTVVMPITLWHAINYWVSYYGKQNDNIGGYSPLDLLAAISAVEPGENRTLERGDWILNPCAGRPSSAGPFQEIDQTLAGIGRLTAAERCTAWLSARLATFLLFETKAGPNNWSVYSQGLIGEFYNNYMAGKTWDGYSLGQHRVSTSRCFTDDQKDPCDNPVVDLSIPGSVGALPHDNGDGTWNVVFMIYNQTPNRAVFTVIALGSDFTDNYDLIGGDLQGMPWLPDWSGRIILSPAIPIIDPGQVFDMVIRIRPKVPGRFLNFSYRVYGENVGVGSLDLSKSAMGIYEDAVPMALIPGTVSASTGQRLNADITFDHQGPATVLDAEISVTGSGIVKWVSLRVPVGNDPTPKRYIATAHLGKVTDVDPRGEWQAKATIKHKGKELISRTLARAYLVS